MTQNATPRTSGIPRPRLLAEALLFVGATLVACDRDDGIPDVPGDDPTVNLGSPGVACSPFEGYTLLEDALCQEFYGSLSYTPEQWEQLACPLGLVLPEGCSTDPGTGFAGVCRLEVGMDGEWQVMLIYLYDMTEADARWICEEDEEISSGIPGLVESITFYPPWE